jgi:hypothetical protein
MLIPKDLIINKKSATQNQQKALMIGLFSFVHSESVRILPLLAVFLALNRFAWPQTAH